MTAPPPGSICLWGRIAATGITTLVHGTATVTGISEMNQKSIILVTAQLPAKGNISVAANTGSGFVITSANPSDAVPVAWVVITPGRY